jgi:toxin HigB-1
MWKLRRLRHPKSPVTTTAATSIAPASCFPTTCGYIRTFRRSVIADFFFDGKPDKKAGWNSVAKIVTTKLDMLHYAQKPDDLRSPPANRLEALKGDLRGFFSIRVNDQWRIVFRWTSSGAEDVDVVDYHA